MYLKIQSFGQNLVGRGPAPPPSADVARPIVDGKRCNCSLILNIRFSNVHDKVITIIKQGCQLINNLLHTTGQPI